MIMIVIIIIKSPLWSLWPKKSKLAPRSLKRGWNAAAAVSPLRSVFNAQRTYRSLKAASGVRKTFFPTRIPLKRPCFPRKKSLFGLPGHGEPPVQITGAVRTLIEAQVP